MVYTITLETLTNPQLNLWSHDILGVVSSETSVPLVLLDLTLQKFPQVANQIDSEELLSQLTDAFRNREDKDFFKYMFELEGEFQGTFYVESAPTLG